MPLAEVRPPIRRSLRYRGCRGTREELGPFLPSFRPSTNIDLTTLPYFWSYRGKTDIPERISVAEKGTVYVGLRPKS